MRKLVYLTLCTLFTATFVSCTWNTSDQAAGTPGPRINIGNMILEVHHSIPSTPNLTQYCGDYEAFGREPDTQTFECDVPFIPRMQIGFGWGAKDTTLRDADWSAMKWELYIDEYQIRLDEFEQWEMRGKDSAGHQAEGRGWWLDLVDLSPGRHTLRLLWKSETSIDDGFDIYAPGTHENIVNFNILEH